MRKPENTRQQRTPTFETPLLVSVPEAARLLGIGPTLGWEMVRDGVLPSVRFGRRVLVPRSAVERLAGVHAQEAYAQEPLGSTDTAPSITPLPLRTMEHS